MSSLQIIKTRLTSVATTKKITKAMQLVATSKLKKSQKNLKSVKEYYLSVQDIFIDLLDKVDDIKEIFPKKNNDKVLYIAITSDMGLAGAYNSNILKLIKQNFKSNDDLIMIGTKGVAAVQSNNWKTILSLPNVGDKPNYDVAQKASKEAMASFLSGSVKEIKLIHTEFINSVTYEAKITTLLPVQSKEKNSIEKENSTTDFEPNVEAVVKGAIPLYFSAMLFGTMVESKVSEMSSRRTAMENATDNAEEIIEKLNIEYNRARQSSITQEINEIVAGSNTE